MPIAPPKPCLDCGALVYGAARCPAHTKARDRRRGTAQERGYDARWNKARVLYLVQNPLCVQCKDEGRLTPATVVDHRIPHRGDMTSFWNVGGWQALCAMHHNAKTAREDGGFGHAPISTPKQGAQP